MVGERQRLVKVYTLGSLTQQHTTPASLQPNLPPAITNKHKRHQNPSIIYHHHFRDFRRARPLYTAELFRRPESWSELDTAVQVSMVGHKVVWLRYIVVLTSVFQSGLQARYRLTAHVSSRSGT